MIIFAPVLFSPQLANLELAQKKLCLKRDNMRHCIHPVLSLPLTMRAKKAKIKWEGIFPCVQYVIK